jgi:hypothetical protein
MENKIVITAKEEKKRLFEFSQILILILIALSELDVFSPPCSD